MKSVPDHFPDWVKRVTVAKRGGKVTHALAEDAAALAYLAGQNVVTIHGWLSKADEPRKPHILIMDFDPPRRAASRTSAPRRAMRATGRDAGLATYAMVTGSRGIQWSARCAAGRASPTCTGSPRRWRSGWSRTTLKLTLEYLKANREDKIYVDVNRNAYAQHAVVPYSPRPKPRATVAAPIHWEELSDGKLRPIAGR